MPTEVIPTNHPHDHGRVHEDLYPPGRTPAQEAHLDELIREQGVKPASERDPPPPLSVSDAEFEEFQSWLRWARGRECGCE